MADDPENHTLRLLREMREEQMAFRAEFTAFRAEVGERFDRLEGRVDGVEGRLDRLETESRSHSETLGKVIDAVTQIAKVQEQQSELLNGFVRIQKAAYPLRSGDHSLLNAAGTLAPNPRSDYSRVA